MEPVTAILAALAAGAAPGVTEVSKKFVGDAYEGLKGLLKGRFGSKPEALTALDQYEKEPEVWKAPLEAALRKSEVDRDSEVLTALKQLTEALNKSGSGKKFDVHIEGTAQGTIVGDHNRIEQNFGAPPRKEP